MDNIEFDILDIPNAQPYDEQTQANFDAIMKASAEKVKKRKRNDDQEEASSKRVKGDTYDSDDDEEESSFYEERLRLSDDDMLTHEEQIEDKNEEIKNIKEMIAIHETDMNSGNKDYGKTSNEKLIKQYKNTLSMLEKELKKLKEISYGGRKHNKTVKKKSHKVKKGKTVKKGKKSKKANKGKSKKGGMHHNKSMKKKKGVRKQRMQRKIRTVSLKRERPRKVASKINN